MASVHKIRQVQLVGRKIRELRKENKLTQTELSARIGIQQSDLSRMEKGEYRVSLDTLFRILAEFNIGIGEFFDAVTKDAMTPRNLQLVRDLSDLCPFVRDQMRLVIDGGVPVGGTPEHFATVIRNDHAKWGKVVRDSGAKLD